MSSGSSFQMLAPATGNDRLPNAECSTPTERYCQTVLNVVFATHRKFATGGEHWIQRIAFAVETNAVDTHTAWQRDSMIDAERHHTFSAR